MTDLLTLVVSCLEVWVWRVWKWWGYQFCLSYQGIYWRDDRETRLYSWPLLPSPNWSQCVRSLPSEYGHLDADWFGLETSLDESITALDQIRKEGKTKYIGLSECSAATLGKANSSQFRAYSHSFSPLLTWLIVAKIDAIQAEYSAFETLHETDGLIQTAKELNVAYVAYSPLGHGWLVDDFNYKCPDDFTPDDFRRTG